MNKEEALLLLINSQRNNIKAILNLFEALELRVRSLEERLKNETQT